MAGEPGFACSSARRCFLLQEEEVYLRSPSRSSEHLRAKHAQRTREEERRDPGLEEDLGQRGGARNGMTCMHARRMRTRAAGARACSESRPAACYAVQGKGCACGPRACRIGSQPKSRLPPRRRAERARGGRTHRRSLASLRPQGLPWAAATHAGAISNTKAASIFAFCYL